MSSFDVERCDRCGRRGDDRRTLWMACWANMDDPSIYTGMEPPPFDKVDVHDKDGRRHHFFTLRVCKGCRADWMHAIGVWFSNGKRMADRFAEGED